MHPSIVIRKLLFRNVAAYLVHSDNAVVLVDTGYEGMEQRVIDALAEEGFAPGDLSLIILTHVHYDHAGGAAALAELTGAKIVVHSEEAETLRQGITKIPGGTRWKGRLLSWIGRIFLPRVMKLPPADAAILLDDRLDLSEWGIPGYLIHTPGHTAGSLSLVLENGKAVVGDNMLGFVNKHYPPFAEDRDAVLDSWQKLLDTGSVDFLPAHGNMIKRKSIEDELPGAIRRYASPDYSARKESSME